MDSNYMDLMSPGTTPGTNWHKDILARWTAEGDNTDVPRLLSWNQSIVQPSDRFIIDASYLSFSNLTFGYSLPKQWTSKLGLQTIRVYFSGENIGLLSKRKGLDPRISISGTQSYSVNSAIRTLSFGLSATL